MTKGADLIGRRFTKLIVTEKSQTRPVRWKCICDCGEVRYIETAALLSKKKARKSCGCHTLSDDKIFVGKIFKTNLCGNVEVIEILKHNKSRIRFQDGTEITSTNGNIRSGSVSNPCAKTAYGVGYNGIGNHRSNGEQAYSYWYKMMQRAYCQEYKVAHPTYNQVEVCSDWHSYQNFADWCVNRKQYGKKGFNLDKDLISKNNKIYCPEYCSLVPQAINKLTVKKSKARTIPQGVVCYENYYVARCCTESESVYLGTFVCPEQAGKVYREFKKQVIIDTANKYRDSLDDAVYEALLNFEVEW